ncbi:replication protein A 70 kDa DNA-binding subunit B-like [Silene latifolia]|uniref:replication protein A 70 kDa DNA-binding subunit B-like n=1 Tax=Silene latifolia TaxID=37657 RepID=UPI003D77360D
MEIPATLFDANVQLFSDVFHPGKVYEITNAVIAPVREDVRRDIIGLAVHVTAPRKVRPKSRNMEFDARDIYLLDQSMKPTTLTVWQAFVSNEAQTISDIVASRPTVLATQVSPSKFRGGRWNTTFFSTVRLDYDGPEAVALRQWEEIARIAEHLHETVGENSRIVLPIAALGFQEDGAIVWIKGHVTHVINPERCVYSSCSICNSGTETLIGDKFPCSQTATPHIGTSVYRCNLQIRFDDESSAIKLTLFDVLAEKVLKRTATEIACLSP